MAKQSTVPRPFGMRDKIGYAVYRRQRGTLGVDYHRVENLGRRKRRPHRQTCRQ